MRRIFKIGIMGLLILFLAFTSLCVWGYRMVMRSLPQTRGEILVESLREKTEIFRDNYHIPHIFAQNTYDLFFSQGFVTAQDRLWQMDLWKRIACGRLSEIIGEPGLQSDSLMLTIGFKRLAREFVPRISDESRDAYKAYTDGINAYIRTCKNNPPVEFNLLSYKPEPWQAEDCIAIARWLSWEVSTGWRTDVTLAAIANKAGPLKAKIFFPDTDHDIHGTLLWKNNRMTALATNAFSDPAGIRKSGGFGSNGWAVSGHKTDTGKPLLANDPHLTLSAPSFFYENHLTGGDWDLWGFSIPGLPGVIIGHNSHIAWGVTNLMADDLDFFVEKQVSTGGTRYEVDGHVLEMDVIEEKIPVRLKEPVHMKIYKTIHGPVVTPFIDENRFNTSAISMRWTGQSFSDEGFSYYHIAKATDWQTFRTALKSYGTAPQMFLYADREGNIGMQAAGMIPVKLGSPDFLPRKGHIASAKWKGTLPFDQLPSEYNPPKGYVAAANQAVPAAGHNRIITPLPALPCRYERIVQLLERKDNLTLQDMKEIQSDVLSLYAVKIIDMLRPTLSGLFTDDSLQFDLSNRLLQWDGRMKSGSMEAALFEVFLNKLVKRTFHDELGDTLFKAMTEFQALPLNALFTILKDDRSGWLDNDSTSRIESRDEIVSASFQAAVNFLREAQGTNTARWSWGDLHILTLEHPLGQHPLLTQVLNLGPFHTGGSGTTLHCTGSRPDQSYKTLWGAAARMIVDLADLNQSASVLNTGQGGHPLDAHYRNQTPLFLNNLTHSHLHDSVKIRNAGFDKLELIPGE